MIPTRLLALLTTSALLLPTVALAQDAAPEPLPEPGTVLEPGRYSSDLVGPDIDFEVGDEWIVGPSGNGPIFTLEYMGAPGSVLSVTRFDGDTFLDSCDPSSLTIVESTVPRLAEIIAGNPYLNPGLPGVTEVDGHTGMWLDVGVPAYTGCALPYVLIWAVPIGEGGEFVQMANQQSRFILLDVGGDVIVLAIESFPGVPFGAFLEASLELVESMRIEPGAWVPAEPAPAVEATAVPSLEPEATTAPEAEEAEEASPPPATPADDEATA